MNPWSMLKTVNWRILAATFCAAGILHISATLAAPELASAPAYARLSRLLPENKMAVLPAITADTQPLPFLSPDARYAMCAFDSSKGTVEIKATLPEPGWTLSLHSPDGDNFYTAVAQPGRETEVALLLIPTDERFAGLTPEAKGQSNAETSVSLTLVASLGVAVLRAPDLGMAHTARNEAGLKAATCGMRKS